MTRPITFSDSAALDAFGRLRVSDIGERLDVEFIYDKQPDFMDETTTNGAVTHNAATRDLSLTLSDANDGSFAKMSSHPVTYTPGDSQLIEITGVLDDADIGGGTASIFLRTSIGGSPTETVIPQSSWFILRSGLDWGRSHIFRMDFQSLKVGRIRYSLVREGQDELVYEIHNDNVRDSGYWQLPSLPVYYKLYTSGGITYAEVGYGDESNAIGFRYALAANASAAMRAICCTVKSEGGKSLLELPGLPRSVSTANTPQTVSTTLYPVLSIRVKDTFKSLPNLGLTVPRTISVETDEAIELVIVNGGTLTGASWVDVGTGSHTEFDVSATAITGGDELQSRYVYAKSTTGGATVTIASIEGILGKTLLWNRSGAQTGILTVAAVRTSASDADVLAAINWDEIR